MRLWRVSDYLDLNGEGGFLFAGRWHSGGRHVIYTAEHSALALLEVLVQLEYEDTPVPYQLLEIDAPDTLEVTEFGGGVPADLRESREWGDLWLASAATPLAKVPSATAPKAFNLLINPAHPDSDQIRLIGHARYPWDVRLFR